MAHIESTGGAQRAVLNVVDQALELQAPLSMDTLRGSRLATLN